MKKQILLIVLFFVVVVSRAQILLEKTYTSSTTLTELAVSGYKYFLMDVVNKQCRLYNMDHSAWKTINLSIPVGMYLYDIRYVSEKLFNTDNNVELAYIYYSYDTTYYYYTYYTRVINENGFELLPIPGAGFLDLKTTTSNGTKLLAYVYNYSIYPSTVNTLVYSLPGVLPTGGITEQPVVEEGLPFPNPARDIVTIPCNLPDGVNQASILLMNSAGKLVRTFTVDRTFDSVQIPTHELPRGLYIYQIKTGSGIISTGRIIHE
jgi:hypothetical protein